MKWFPNKAELLKKSHSLSEDIHCGYQCGLEQLVKARQEVGLEDVQFEMMEGIAQAKICEQE